MAKKGTINEFYDIAALRAQQQTAVQFVDEFISKVASVKPIAVSLQGADKTGEILKGIQELTKAQRDYTQASLNAVKAAESEARARANNAKAAKDEAKAADTVARTKEREEKTRKANEKTIEREAKAREREEKKLKDAANEYLKLSRAYQEAALQAKTYAVTLGESHPTTIQAVADAKAMDEILKRVDASVGQNQRNVGNYAGALNGLSTSFGQIARELPALAINANTFFLAISNNLPMFFDAMGRAREEIGALRAQGQQVPTLFQALSRSIFSLNTVLTLAVTALTLFGGKIVDFIGSLFKADAGISALNKNLEKLNEQFAEGDKKVRDFIDNLEFLAKKRRIEVEMSFLNDPGLANLKNIRQDTSDLYDSFSQLNNELLRTQQAFDNISFETLRALQKDSNFKGASVADALGMSDSDIEKLDENTQKALKSFKQLNDRRSQQIKDAEGLRRLTEINVAQTAAEERKRQEDISDAQREAAESRIASQADINRRNQAERQKDRERQLKDEVDLQKALSQAAVGGGLSISARAKQLEAEKALINSRKNFELNKEKEKIAEINKIRASQLSDEGLSPMEITAINARAEAQIAAARLTGEERKAIITEANRAILAAEAQYTVDIIALNQQMNKAQRAEGEATTQAYIDEVEKRQAKEIETATEGHGRTLQQIERFADKRLTALNNEYRKGEIGKRAYEKKKIEIENEALKERLQNQIDYYEFLLKTYKFDAATQEQFLTQIAALRKQLSAVGLKEAKTEAEKVREALVKLANELKGLTFDLFTGSIERQKNAIQDQIDMLEKAKQKDIEFENSRTQTVQERAANIAIIEARAQAEKEQLQQRQRRLDQEKARFDRAEAITNIIQQTAVGVMEASPNFLLMALVGALGAAQIARVLSQPIPRYAKGTDDHPGGPAIVGDGGKKELVLTPDGRYMITQATPQTIELPRHSIVLPDAEAALLHTGNRVQNITAAPTFQQPSHSLQKEFRQLRKTIENKRENHFFFPSAVENYMRSGYSWLQHRKG